jgi:hypothetical protein
MWVRGDPTIYIYTSTKKKWGIPGHAVNFNIYSKETRRRTKTALSLKQFGKYLSIEIFPARMGIVPKIEENFCSAISKEEVPLVYGKIFLL